MTRTLDLEQFNNHPTLDDFERDVGLFEEGHYKEGSNRYVLQLHNEELIVWAAMHNVSISNGPTYQPNIEKTGYTWYIFAYCNDRKEIYKWWHKADDWSGVYEFKREYPYYGKWSKGSIISKVRQEWA